MLILHISYKPPSYLKISIWYGGQPRQVSHIKGFMTLLEPLGVWNKEEVLQVILMPSFLSGIGRNSLEEKVCNVSVFP